MLSVEAEATVKDGPGCHITRSTADLWPVRVSIARPVSGFHILTVQSEEEEARSRLSVAEPLAGDQLRLVTGP